MSPERRVGPWLATLAIAASGCALAVDFNALRAGTESAYETAVMADKPYGFFPLHDPPNATTVTNLGSEMMQGQVMGGVTFNGSYATFDGSSGYIDLGADFSFSGSSGLAPFTLEAWIQPDVSDTSASDTASLPVLWEGTLDSSTGYFDGYNVIVQSGAVGFGRGAGMNSCGATSCDSSMSSCPSLPTSFHFATTYDGSGGLCLIFINGVPGPSGSCSAGNNPVLMQQGTLKIGADPNTQSFFQGRISEVAIYQTTLTDAQIQAHFNAGMNGP